MAMSYKVRFWDIRERPKRRKPFEVRWTVNGREQSESFITKGLAESRRAKLMTAARDGEAFDEQTGLPASEIRAIRQRTTWYDLAHAYIDGTERLATPVVPSLMHSPPSRPRW
ncbi:hypothetical protein [Streptomyces sp. NPDC085596]|uniref:hypothetical protein n=1 Tax=Streptomyces sp. NPDC085596 TaxID=3365731 RepID=UPI0037D816EB